jgi:hypothetical protein
MTIQTAQRSNIRVAIASALFLAAIGASVLISYISQPERGYWVLTRPLPIGVEIGHGDIKEIKANLSRSADGYLSAEQNVVGAITLRNFAAGEILHLNSLSSNRDVLTTEHLSLLIRATDIPGSAQVGDTATLYQVRDARNGEDISPPQLVISGVFISEINRKNANFASDLAITIALNRSEIAKVLAATTIGRIVVVPNHG